jgi:hypothetical protein
MNPGAAGGVVSMRETVRVMAFSLSDGVSLSVG